MQAVKNMGKEHLAEQLAEQHRVQQNCNDESGMQSYTVCALIFAGFIFRGFAIFAFFACLNSRLLGAVVLKYSRIYRVSPYTIIVYGSCRSAKLAGLVLGFV